MYFLEQIRGQFSMQLASYQQSIEGPSEAETTPPRVEWHQTPDEVQQEVVDWTPARQRDLEARDARADQFEGDLSALESTDDIRPLTQNQMRNEVRTTSAERESARMLMLNEGGVDPSDAEITDHITRQRREDLADPVTVLVGWEEIEVSESTLIAQVSEDSWIPSEMLEDLRVMWRLWIWDFEGEELKVRLESMSEEMWRIRNQMEQNGQKFPETTEEYLALYNYLEQNDGSNEGQPINPADAEASWLDIVTDQDGIIGINPEWEWVQVVWNTTFAPDGSYSRWGNVYSAQRSQWSWADVPPSSVTEWVTTIDPANNSSPQLEAYSNEHNKEIIKSMVPAEWHGAAIEMAKKAWTLQEWKVIALSAMTSDQGPVAIVCYPEPAWEVHTFPIIIWENWYDTSVSEWDKTTPVNALFNFDAWNAAGRWNDASKWGSSTVLGWAAYSPEAWALWGRWWHGVADHRIPGWKTHGCIGWKQENMIALASAINRHWGWYGMNLVSKQG